MEWVECKERFESRRCKNSVYCTCSEVARKTWIILMAKIYLKLRYFYTAHLWPCIWYNNNTSQNCLIFHNSLVTGGGAIYQYIVETNCLLRKIAAKVYNKVKNKGYCQCDKCYNVRFMFVEYRLDVLSGIRELWTAYMFTVAIIWLFHVIWLRSDFRRWFDIRL